MKRILSLFLLSLVIMMFSCKEDDFAHDSEIQNKQNISFEELQKKLSGSSVSKRFSIPGIMGKDMTDFEIDTAKIVEIKAEDVTTYSMKVVPLSGEDGNLYNLYLYDKNGEIFQEIVKYKLEDGKSISAENTEVIYTDRLGCLILVIAPCEYGYWHDDDHCEGGGWVTIKIGDCGSSGGGGGGGGSGDGGGDTGGNDPVTPVGHEPADGSGGGGGGVPTIIPLHASP